MSRTKRTSVTPELPKEPVLEELVASFPQADKSTLKAMISFIKVGRELDLRISEYFSKHGLSGGRFTLLMLLRSHYPEAGLTPSALAQKSRVSCATVTGLLDGLENLGFIKREKHESDRRAILIRLTLKGYQILGKILPDHFARVSTLMSDLKVEERRQLADFMERIHGKLDAFDQASE